MEIHKKEVNVVPKKSNIIVILLLVHHFGIRSLRTSFILEMEINKPKSHTRIGRGEGTSFLKNV